jgi:DNA polymerase-3 subunit epsilon
MREIVIDTETTGLDPLDGHRIIEIGAVELVNHSLTGQTFHRYLCPERSMPSGPSNIQAIVRVWPHPLPPRVTADDRNVHREFVRTIGNGAVWLDYFTIRSVAA